MYNIPFHQDPKIWRIFLGTVCNVTGFCEVGPDCCIEEYQDFVQGTTAAFLNTYAQGQPDYLDYLLVEEDIPIKLSIYETDLECEDDGVTSGY